MEVEKIIEEIKKRGLTGYKIAQETSLTEVGVNKIINGESKKPRKTTIEVLQNYLFNKNITVKENNSLFNKNGNEFIEKEDGSYVVKVELVPFDAYASYVEHLNDVSMPSDLNEVYFNVDKFGKGNYKAFRIKGDSMNGGMMYDTPDGALVLGRELSKSHWRDGFHKSDYGFIILCHENIFHKDIIKFNKDTGEVTLHSRNKSPEYSDFIINLNDCYSIYKVIKRTF